MADHYFTDTPMGPEQRRTIRARIWGDDIELYTANGVFSGDRLDLGTSVLLRESPLPQGSPRLLDLGCGYGPIAVALALNCPGAVVDAVDVNDRALALCRDNARAHGVADRVTVLRPEDADPSARYAEIWSNPPIRIGKEALHQLLGSWLPRLTPTGIARLVVSRNLGADSMQRWLIDQGYDCQRLASAKGFRVLTVKPH
ncbi:MAG: methyltransferase [Propionibacteriaceae bacterium]|nr:methyltransferase [Propionibacteriaceae bacterium]